MSNPFIAEIRIMGFTFAPRSWAFCNGQTIPIVQNTALFSLLGTTYGGNGTTNFALPDLRSRLPMHAGNGPGLSGTVLGEQGGTETVTLLSNQVPAHNHGGVLVANNGAASAPGPVGNVPAKPAGNVRFINLYSNAATDATNGTAIAAVGGGQPHTNLQPYLAINFCICLFGVFPSRN